MATITPVDKFNPFGSCPDMYIPSTGITDCIPVQQNAYHQLDFYNPNTAGSIPISVDFGAGLRVIATVDLADQTRKPVIIFGRIKSISFSPTGVTGNTTLSYVASHAQ